MILSSVVMVLFRIAIIGTFTPDYKVHHLDDDHDDDHDDDR